MTMIIDVDYNKVRGFLTTAISSLEFLCEKSKAKQRPQAYLSEYDYWLSSLELLRNCLYDCTDTYTGQINIGYAVLELSDEVTNFIKVVKKIEVWELKHLDKVWCSLKAIEEMLIK